MLGNFIVCSNDWQISLRDGERAFDTIHEGVEYGLRQGVPFSVARPSGALAATKPHGDSPVRYFYTHEEAAAASRGERP